VRVGRVRVAAGRAEELAFFVFLGNLVVGDNFIFEQNFDEF
jgi:hypothetical protein